MIWANLSRTSSSRFFSRSSGWLPPSCGSLAVVRASAALALTSASSASLSIASSSSDISAIAFSAATLRAVASFCLL